MSGPALESEENARYNKTYYPDAPCEPPDFFTSKDGILSFLTKGGLMRALHIKGCHPEDMDQELVKEFAKVFGSLAYAIYASETPELEGPERLVQGRGGSQMTLRGQVPLREFAQRSGAGLVLVFGLEDGSFPSLIMGRERGKGRPSGSLAMIHHDGQGVLADGRSFDLDKAGYEFVQALGEGLFPALAGLDCGKCRPGTCAAMVEAVLQGQAGPEDCLAMEGEVAMTFDGQRIGMVPFVERIAANMVLGLAREMKGYTDPKQITLTLRPRPKEETGRKA